MKRIFLSFPALVLGAALLMLAPTSALSGKQGMKSPHTRSQAKHAMPMHSRFDPARIETVKGKVTDVTEPRSKARVGEMRLTIKTDHETLPVVLGPASYLKKDDFKIAKGDEVAVTGSRVTMHSRPTIIATQVRKGDKNLDLRKPDGSPLWGAQGSKSK